MDNDSASAKGGGGGERGIWLVAVIWKIYASTINIRICSSITLHDAIYRFRQGRGTGTETLEAKLAHQLAGIFHDPLFQVLLDVRKDYNYLDMGSCMNILEGHVLGTKLHILQHRFGYDQAVVPKARRFYGQNFRMEIGVTQGEPVPPTLFNIMADAVVKAVCL